jgi:hypothetical protein
MGQRPAPPFQVAIKKLFVGKLANNAARFHRASGPILSRKEAGGSGKIHHKGAKARRRGVAG